METAIKPFEKRTYISLLTFFSIALFYAFESAQMAYFNVLAPSFLSVAGYTHGQIASVSAAYYYGDMIGLFPVGYLLDRYPLRKVLMFALIGTLIGAYLLFASEDVYLQWIARFMCGLFGGTFSFLGGIRVIALIYPKRFTYFMGIFLAGGMLGGLLSQYPLLLAVHHYGIQGTMEIMFICGVIILLFNFLFLHPGKQSMVDTDESSAKITFNSAFKTIVLNLRNLTDVMMVVCLDTPVSIIGTLWGIVLLMNYFHYTATLSAWIIMSLFAGLIVGLPTWGHIADKNNYPAWIIVLGAGASFMITLAMLSHTIIAIPGLVGALFFALGFFSSCQSLGFTWLTKNMKPELIGRNSAYNSMIFMGSNGGFKQLGAILLSIPALLIPGPSAVNLLIFVSATMLVAMIYAYIRGYIYH